MAGEAPRDEECALRLITHPDQFKDNQIISAVFKTRKPDAPNYANVSLYVRERLPNRSWDCLHVQRLQNSGRVAIGVVHLRGTEYVSPTGPVRPFDAVMTPDQCVEPHLDFAAAHATLTGPTYHAPSVSALAVQVRALGTVEKLPEFPKTSR